MKLFGRFSFAAVLLLSFALVTAGCGGGDDEFDLDEEEWADNGEGGGSGSATIDPATAGEVKGAILFEGTPPVPKSIDMSADPVCAGSGEEGITEAVVVNDGKLANVFVYISSGLDGKFKAPDQAVELTQRGCRYHPHIVGVVANQTLLIKNDDATLHNVHAMPKINDGFNFAQPSQGMTNEQKFTKEEVMIPIKCDVHGWMSTYVGVLNHPAFAVSAEDGSFSFKAPPGEYTVTAWHETLGTREEKVTIGASEEKEVNFTFSAQ